MYDSFPLQASLPTVGRCRCRRAGGLEVLRAPEPSDIQWEDLACGAPLSLPPSPRCACTLRVGILCSHRVPFRAGRTEHIVREVGSTTITLLISLLGTSIIAFITHVPSPSPLDFYSGLIASPAARTSPRHPRLIVTLA